MKTMTATMLTALCTPIELVTDIESYRGAWGAPNVYVGPPGIGKTEGIKAICAKLKLLYHVFPTDSLQLDDLEGVYMAGERPGTLTRAFFNPEVQAILEAGEGVLFFDELNTNVFKTDNAIRRVFLGRELVRRPMPKMVRVLAAMNPPEISMGGKPMSAPMSNSVVHMKATEHSREDWLKYRGGYDAQTDGLENIEVYLRLLRSNWSAEYSRTFSQISLMLRKNPNMLNQLPKRATDQAHAWPSERSWSMVHQTLTTARALGMPREVQELFVEGSVGSATCAAFWDCVDSARMPTVADVLANGWTPDPMETDVAYAVHIALDYEVQPKLVAAEQPSNASIDLAWRAWRQVRLTAKEHKDATLSTCKMLQAQGYGSMLGRFKSKSPAKIEEILQAADFASKMFGDATPLLYGKIR